MPDKALPIFFTLWFSCFFFLLGIAHKIISIEWLSMFDSLLLTLICVTSSYEIARQCTFFIILKGEDRD